MIPSTSSPIPVWTIRWATLHGGGDFQSGWHFLHKAIEGNHRCREFFANQAIIYFKKGHLAF
jgi:hypothetical protein